jgi:hypothetical protein
MLAGAFTHGGSTREHIVDCIGLSDDASDTAVAHARAECVGQTEALQLCAACRLPKLVIGGRTKRRKRRRRVNALAEVGPALGVAQYAAHNPGSILRASRHPNRHVSSHLHQSSSADQATPSYARRTIRQLRKERR